MNTAVSVVIVNWNSGSDLSECLASLARNPPSAAYEVIVVDNGSTDGSVDLARAVVGAAQTTYQLNRSNRGLAGANNQGLLRASGEVVVLSNPDVRFRSGAVDALVQALQRHERAAAVEPKVLLTDGSVQSTAGDLPSLLEGLVGRQAQRRRGARDGFCWDGWSYDEEVPVGRVGDVCYAVRRRSVAEVGLFDERFPLDWEGIDWSARAADLGWEHWFVPSAVVDHRHGGSTRKARRTRWVLQTHHGMYRYFANRKPYLRPFLAVAFGARALGKLAIIKLGYPMYERGTGIAARSAAR